MARYLTPRTTKAYMRTLLKECVRLCSPRGNVRRDVRLVAEKGPICELFEGWPVRSCSRTSEQMFASSCVRLQDSSSCSGTHGIAAMADARSNKGETR
jgi:hypothetical protein